MEPGHLVARAAVQFQPRADRRAVRRDARDLRRKLARDPLVGREPGFREDGRDSAQGDRADDNLAGAGLCGRPPADGLAHHMSKAANAAADQPYLRQTADWQRIADAGGSFERAQELLRTQGMATLTEVAECFETGELPVDDLPF